MVNITQRVVYNEVKDQLFAEELITLEDLDEYDKLTNAEAVRKMTRKVMHSITLCEKFLKILEEMQQQPYQELAEIINEKCKQIEGNCITKYTNQVTAMLQETESPDGEPVGNANIFQVIPQQQVHEILQESTEAADILLQQNPHMKLILNAIQVKKVLVKASLNIQYSSLKHFVMQLRKMSYA